MGKGEAKKVLKKLWWFIWEDDSVLSWAVNIVLAFVLIKFIVYPGLGFVLGTNFPIVAVVSSSMEHNSGFDDWWDNSNAWYLEEGITKDKFLGFPLKNGFYKGDIMVLVGKKPESINVGDVVVFISHRQKPKADPIIHRVVRKWQEDGGYHFQTKGDNYKTNANSINTCRNGGCVDETDIIKEQMIGKAVFRVPLLGYIKILFVEYLAAPYCRITNNFFPCR